MANSSQHRAKATRNRRFLNTISVNNDPDWAAVVAFYEAVHLVERLRTRLPNAADQHSADHQDRLSFVQTRHPGIETAFRDLYNASLVARYRTIVLFNRLYPPSHVQNILIDQHLVAIERYVDAFFAPPPPPTVAGTGS